MNIVPNYFSQIEQLHATRLFDLRTHEGSAAYVDACVSLLHGLDPAWGHLIKKPGQTDVHDHGEDAALYLFPDGTARAVDFVVGAGGPSPRPGWNVDEATPYKRSDWHDPTDHGIREGAAPPARPLEFPPRDLELEALRELNALYKDAGRPERGEKSGLYIDDEGIAVWFGDYLRRYATGDHAPTTVAPRDRHAAALDAVKADVRRVMGA